MPRLAVAMLLGTTLVIVACKSSLGEAPPDSGPCVSDRAPPGAAQCPAICTMCLPGNVCRIECNAGDCNDMTVTCPADYACEVACSGLDSCDTSTIQCPAQYACSLTCTAYDACGDVTLACGAGSCAMTCNGPTESCVGSKVDCATGGDCKAACNDTAGPTMDCAGACGCAGC